MSLDIRESLSGQPWRWRYKGGDDLTRDLTDQLLLARGVTEDDLPRQREPRLRDFLPDPSVFKEIGRAHV